MGAEPADAARARPILEQLCRRLEHCGPVGAGAVMKLTINMPLMIYWQALGEALALCRPLGLDPDADHGPPRDTSGGPNVLKVRAPGVAQMLKGGDAGPVTFDIDSAVKDLRTMVAEGKRAGSSCRSCEKTLACYEETKRNVSGDGRRIRRVGLLGEPRQRRIGDATAKILSSASDHLERQMSVVNLAQASTIVDAALEKGARRNCAPLTVAVLDAGGHLVAFKREDNPASCVSTSLSARPGARSAWASARARSRRARPRRPCSSPCSRRPAAAHGDQSRRRADPKTPAATSSALWGFPAIRRIATRPAPLPESSGGAESRSRPGRELISARLIPRRGERRRKSANPAQARLPAYANPE